MDTAVTVTQSDIVSGLRRLGVRPGDVVFFHSSLKSFGNVEGGADAVIDAFIEAVGPEGTVVAPTFNLIKGDRKANWDIATTPSTVGTITEVFRLRPESVRSNHYSHAVSAIGKRANELVEGHDRVTGRDAWWPGAFGIGSPFDKLYRWDARYLLVGVDFHVCTMFHYVECWLHEEYLKPFDPKVDLLHTHRLSLGSGIEVRGLVQSSRIGQSKVRLMSARELVDASLNLLLRHPTRYATRYARSWFISWAHERGFDVESIPWPKPGPPWPR